MFKILKIQDFKCFSGKALIQLSQLTICTGMNSVGKSTLIQALLLLKQSFGDLSNVDDDSHVLLNTKALNLGSTNQVMLTDKMILSLDDNLVEFSAGEDKLSLKVSKIKDTNKKIEGRIVREEFFNSGSDNELETLSNTELYYLNAERLGPRNYQQMKSHDKLHCGYHGEYTYDVIEKNPHIAVSEKRRFQFEPSKKIPDLMNQVTYWTSYIVNGVEVNFSSDLTTQLSQMKVRQAALDTQFNSPYNFGFGISYVLPIITAELIAESKSMVIVENPEAHLHPAGQSRIGEFLAQISSAGIQVIIETHSEHVINGIRKYALKNSFSADDICLNYFSINTQTQKHEVSRLQLNDRMDILEWPEGFFDQEANDLKELRKLRMNQK